MSNFSIAQTTRSVYPKHPYETIKNDILGKNYTLSLTFVGECRAQKLNQTYRQKDYVPNVLSFPLDKNNGEIFIAPAVAKRQAKNFDLSVSGYIGYLFIHACLHLKGHKHGATMESTEKRYLNKYRLS